MHQNTYKLLTIIAALVGMAADNEVEPLPPGASARLGTTRWRTSGDALFIGFRAGGSELVTVSKDNQWQVWDAVTGKQLRRCAGIEHGWIDAAMSPDGATLAIANDRGTVTMWDVVSGRKGAEIQAAPASCPPEVIFTKDDKSLFTLDSSEVRIKRWSSVTGLLVRRFDEPPLPGALLARYGCPGLLASADGRVLLSLHSQVSPEKKLLIALWDPDAGLRTHVVAGVRPADWLSAAALSPDGRRFAWASIKGQLRLHDLTADKELLQLDDHLQPGIITDIVFSPSGRSLATRLADGAVHIWDCATGKEQMVLNQKDWAALPPIEGTHSSRLAFSPDGQVLAVSSGQVLRVFDLKDGRSRSGEDGHASDVQALRLSPDGRHLTTQDRLGHELNWDFTTGKPLSESREARKAVGLKVQSPDGQTIGVLKNENTIELLDAKTGQVLSTMALSKLNREHKQDFRTIDTWAGLLFTPDGRTAITRGGDRQSLDVWRVADGKRLRTLRVQRAGLAQSIGSGRYIPGFGIAAVTLAPDGANVAASFWGFYTGASPFNLRNHAEEIVFFALDAGQETRSILLDARAQHLAFAPNGRMVLTYGEGSPISVVEVATGKERTHFDLAVDCLTFAPDGRTFTAAGSRGDVCLWDVATGKKLGQFIGHRGAVRALAFTPDGRKLISGSADTTALVWDVGTLAIQEEKQSGELSAEQLQVLWDDLGRDAGIAYQAMSKLIAFPKQAVPMLTDRAHPPVAAAAPEIQQWIEDLASPRFAARKHAMDELALRSEEALPALHKALQGQPGLEARQRLEELVSDFKNGRIPAAKLRYLRAMEVLDSLHTATPAP